MKIRRIKTFILGTGGSKDLPFCRVETEDGLYGRGSGVRIPSPAPDFSEEIRVL
jgi:hypothetical protein